MQTSVALPREGVEGSIGRDDRLSAAFVWVAIAALSVGMFLGLLQGLEHAGLDAYPLLQPLIRSYYQGLTLHGVLNALVWTTFFITGFLNVIVTRALVRPLASHRLAVATFWVSVVGVLLAAWPMLTNDATVMFTFYPPLSAHWAFYLGLTLVVVGTWLTTLNYALTWRAWRREHPRERTPLPAFMSLVTFAMWTIASLGIAAEMLFLNLPAALGITGATDPILARTLFWYTGHPIVYFWLLPAYVSWYNLVPRLAGGKLFSDPMARVSFLLFLVLSTPVGLHHQYTDPGIAQSMKALHGLLTFAVFFPSLLTFFNVMASLENAGRNHGGRGWLGWIPRLPWGNPILAGQLLAMLTFIFGGIGGLINASPQLNLAVHNSAWVVGHFHLTVGTAVTLSFMAISYWLVPLLSGRELWSRRLALVQVWSWVVGMLLFSNSLHRLGLLDMPRRTAIGQAPYILPEWQALLPLVAIGGTILFLSGLLYVWNCAATALAGRRLAERLTLDFALASSGPERAPWLLDTWKPWLALAAVLILLAYGPPLIQLLQTTSLNTPLRRVW